MIPVAGNRTHYQRGDLNEKNIYIQSATLNGKPFSRSSITHEEIVNGGELVFEMGDKPNTNWGIGM